MWWLTLGLALAGCTSVLGLERTERSPDGDGDGVLDAIDNCPDVANPDQLDADGNGLGDACEFCRNGQDLDRDGIDDGCDACPKGANTDDEDGDGIADACDPCPAIPGPATDTDGDGVGDACDLSSAPQRRRFFDGFVRVIPAWTSQQPWTTADGTTLSTGGADLDLYAVRVANAIPEAWSVTVGLAVPALPTTMGVGTEFDIQLGVTLFDSAHLYPVFCGLTSRADGWHLVITEMDELRGPIASPFGALAFPADTHLDLRVYATRPDPSTAEIECEAGGDHVGYTPILDTPRGIGLRGTLPTRFSYADIIAP